MFWSMLPVISGDVMSCDIVLGSCNVPATTGTDKKLCYG